MSSFFTSDGRDLDAVHEKTEEIKVSLAGDLPPENQIGRTLHRDIHRGSLVVDDRAAACGVHAIMGLGGIDRPISPGPTAGEDESGIINRLVHLCGNPHATGNEKGDHGG